MRGGSAPHGRADRAGTEFDLSRVGSGVAFTWYDDASARGATGEGRIPSGVGELYLNGRYLQSELAFELVVRSGANFSGTPLFERRNCVSTIVTVDVKRPAKFGIGFEMAGCEAAFSLGDVSGVTLGGSGSLGFARGT